MYSVATHDAVVIAKIYETQGLRRSWVEWVMSKWEGVKVDSRGFAINLEISCDNRADRGEFRDPIFILWL